MGRHESFIGLVLVLSALFAFGSCAGDAPQNLDQGIPPPQPYPDYGQPTLDQGAPKRDQYAWPDQAVAPPPDTWPNPADSYTSAPFGCTLDEDCFGRQCCVTPWGVKLCMDECPADLP